MDIAGKLRLPVFVIGVLLLWVAERHLAAESYLGALRISAMVITGLGLGLTLAKSFAAIKRNMLAEARAWRYAVLWQIVLFFGLICYLIYRTVMGDEVIPVTFLQKSLLASWVTFTIVGLFFGIGTEWTMRAVGTGELSEPGRVWKSGIAWVNAGLLLVALVGLNYAGVKKDIVRDWSYLKTTSPSESTINMLKTLTDDIQIALFYPQTNDVLLQVQSYFEQLAQQEPRVKLSIYDKDMHPAKAEEYRVPRNGQIVFDYKEKKSRIDTGDTLGGAKKILKKLDSEFQKKFLEATEDKKIAYFTRGHGESSWVGGGSKDPLRKITLLEKFLRSQNYKTKLFGIGEGSAKDVPDDASVVVVVGPDKPFQKAEVDALKRYVEKGGHLAIYLDVTKSKDLPEGLAVDEWPLHDYLAEIGFKYERTPLVNDRNHYKVTSTVADRWFIHTDIFTSHESVVSLSRHEERVEVGMFQSGYFKVTPELGEWKNFETVRSLSDTFVDLNNDLKFNENEKRDSYVLGAVGEKRPKGEGKKSRVMVFADATIVTDAVIRNEGNIRYFHDGLSWLIGRPETQGGRSNEEDVEIRHTNKTTAIWFNTTVAIVPFTVLGAGYLATRRKRRARKGKSNA